MRLLVALVAVLAFPAAALGAMPSIVAREVPLGGQQRALAAAPRFDLVGLHWRGPGAVEFRTRSLAGRWSAWRAAAPEDEDRPDRSSLERTRPGWHAGNPYWTGASDRLEVRTRGRVARVRAWYVSSDVGGAPPRALSLAGSPQLVTRAQWGANELIKRAAPSYAPSLSFAVVHHTAGANAYTRQESAAIVRGIQTYHVKANGWNDLGYNFLVDKYGQVFEGRYGGVERNVVGAHAEGFNTGSVGVAVIGTYGAANVSPAARDALVRLLAWRLDVAHVDPLATLNWTSGGNPRFPRGVPVFLRSIVGHRDTGFTECPGTKLYGQLDELAQSVAATGLPKLYAPAAKGGIGSLVRFTARLSAPSPWTVAVTDAAGQTVASGTGSGQAVDWTWDATRAAQGPYAWSIASPGARPATGTLGRAGTLSVTRVRAEPAAVTPNGDGVDDETTIRYTLGAAATVTATLLDPAGTPVATLFSEPRAAGDQGFEFTAENVPDGAYTIVVSASGAGKVVTGRAPLLVNRTLSAFKAGRASFSPNRDGRADAMPFTFALAQPATVKLRILLNGKWVATPAPETPLGPGVQVLAWDGSKRIGRPKDGLYEAELRVTDVLGTVTQRVAFGLDTTPPALRLLSLRPRVRISLSEAAEVVVRADGRRTLVKKRGAGVVVLPHAARALRATAYDTAGNRSAVLVAP
ncbi:MAG TPA: N-acetylmuramoyl-L-alanine amidase [Gaiellaceae bacterium]|nr:N-acetylmuramoyl-L-alanine amidase [Gaiellaceae bacterium]